MANIKEIVEAESAESCVLPECALTMAEPVPLTADKIRQVMAALRDPANSIDVHRVAAKTKVSWVHVRDIRDAMRAKVQSAAVKAPEIEKE